MPFEAKAFIGLAGRGGRVEVWAVDSGGPNERTVAVFDRKVGMNGRWVGSINGRVSSAVSALKKVAVLEKQRELLGMSARAFVEPKLCFGDLEILAPKHGVSTERVMQVDSTFVEDAYHGEGIGVALYIALAALANKLGLAIAADACFASDTSKEARRVWKSKEFQEYVEVGRSNLVGVFKR